MRQTGLSTLHRRMTGKLLTILCRARQRFATANSDLLSAVKAYDQATATGQGSGRSAQQQFCEDNFISASAVREITSLRRDLYNALASIGFVPLRGFADNPDLNTHSSNYNLVKAVICGGLWPRIAHVSTPKAVFDQVQSGTIERDHEAKEYKVFEESERVFVHPQSVMFSALDTTRSRFLAYFVKSMTSKVFLRDVTEVRSSSPRLFAVTNRLSPIRCRSTVSYSLEVPLWLITWVEG